MGITIAFFGGLGLVSLALLTWCGVFAWLLLREVIRREDEWQKSASVYIRAIALGFVAILGFVLLIRWVYTW